MFGFVVVLFRLYEKKIVFERVWFFFCLNSGGPSFPNMDQIHSENICVELMPLIHCEDMETVKVSYSEIKLYSISN